MTRDEYDNELERATLPEERERAEHERISSRAPDDSWPTESRGRSLEPGRGVPLAPQGNRNRGLPGETGTNQCDQRLEQEDDDKWWAWWWQQQVYEEADKWRHEL